ncbi:MAG: SLATT domain-containing protein [Eubacteriales bacterium]
MPQEIREKIVDEIKHKKDSFDKVRNARIEYSKRMRRSDNSWRISFFVSNFSAIFLFIISIYESDSTIALISGAYSIYIILLQYTINEFRYHEKYILASRNELLIEKKIAKLKKLVRISSDKDSDYLEKKYNKICDSYTKELEYFPNHSSRDFKLAKIRKIISENENDKHKTFYQSGLKIVKLAIKISSCILPFMQITISVLLILWSLNRGIF